MNCTWNTGAARATLEAIEDQVAFSFIATPFGVFCTSVRRETSVEISQADLRIAFDAGLTVSEVVGAAE